MDKPPLEGMNRSRALTIAIQEIKEEALRAMGAWPPFHSIHEGMGVVLEEMNELWDEARAKHVDQEKMRKEVIHTGAMIARFAAELTLPAENGDKRHLQHASEDELGEMRRPGENDADYYGRLKG